MKKLIIILVLVFAANIVKAQTSTSPKIHLWVDEGEGDYTIPNELWSKLGDSRIFNKLGSYGYNYKWDKVKEWDYIVLALYKLMPNISGNTVTLVLCQFKKRNGFNELVFLSNAFQTSVDYQHINMSVDACYKYILDWHDEYMK